MSQNKNNMLFFGVLIAVFIIFAILGSFSSDNAEDTLFTETTTITQTTTEITTETTATTITSTTALTTAETPAISQPAEVTNINETVYIGKTGTKYHRQDCGTLKGNGTAITLDKAIAKGRTACKICKP